MLGGTVGGGPAPTGWAALDLGGVLLADSTETAFRVLGGRAGLPAGTVRALWESELRVPADTGDMGSDQVFDRIADATGLTAALCEQIVLGGFRPIPEGVALFHALRAAGKRTILATNHLVEWLDGWMRQHPWLTAFDAVVCSAEVGCRKPDAEFYDHVIAAAGGDTGFWFVDDSPANTAAARENGLVGITAHTPEALSALAARLRSAEPASPPAEPDWRAPLYW